MRFGPSARAGGRAFAVKVEGKRLPVSPFSGFDLYHHFRNDAFYGLYNLLKVQKTGKREVVLGQPLHAGTTSPRGKTKSHIATLVCNLRSMKFTTQINFYQ